MSVPLPSIPPLVFKEKTGRLDWTAIRGFDLGLVSSEDPAQQEKAVSQMKVSALRESMCNPDM